MDQPVILSTGAIGAVTTLLGGMALAIGYLWRSGREREKELTAEAALRQKELTAAAAERERELTAQLVLAKDQEIGRTKETNDRLMSMLDRLIPAVEETSRQVQRLVTLIETWRPGRHE